MMLTKLVKKTFGSRNDRLLKKLTKTVAAINALEPDMVALSNEELSAKTPFFKAQYEQGVSLDTLLPEAFAVVREVSKRLLHMRHFDVQLIGGMVLHSGKIAEMRTGEGKTLVATLPAYLNAITGQGVHIVTVNDYLAKRDAEWNMPVYEFLGLTVGVVTHGLTAYERQAAYAADITYGTNNEFGFDYLRDNMAFSPKDRVQRALAFAIVDEVDSILIDEARTPLIISGADHDSSELYIIMNRIVPKLKSPKVSEDADYSIDEKARQVFLTEKGHDAVEQLLADEGLLSEGNLYDATHIGLMHHLHAALKAHALFKKDVDYIVRDNQVIIVDEHTGRTMPGRRWSEGIHQAVEAKERADIQSESQTLASITFQNYFRMYHKLAGMTGTADTEAFEFQQIYQLETVVIPTNRSSQRQDLPDLVYLTLEDKFEAIIEDVKACSEKGQPVLVGTASIETSEFVSALLKKRGIKHQVLNAKQHEREAEIIAEAGRPGTVTIATNMAGRGTDIVLGGSLALDEEEGARELWQQRHDAVLKAGGLHIVGTERHESRRIDNQLRGRAGRQGDPGSTRFYLSLKDNLMRIFVSDRVASMFNKLGLEKGEAITHSLVSNAIEKAQRQVESHNFDIRKQLLEFDDVANDQRRVIYQRRDNLLESESIQAVIESLVPSVITKIFDEYCPVDLTEDYWDFEGLANVLESEFGLECDVKAWLKSSPDMGHEAICAQLIQELKTHLHQKEARFGEETMRHLEKTLMLSVLDSQWKDHLATMDYMRQSIHLRSYAQKDPKQEYKREAFIFFNNMLASIEREVISQLSLIEIRQEADVTEIDNQWRQGQKTELNYTHPSLSTFESDAIQEQPSNVTRINARVGRNDACPCGSGRKYKVCHGRLGA